MLSGVYDWRLVALSYVVAVAASYTALDLAGRVTAARGRARIAWLLGGAFAMGVGIWSMHFTGMLAFSLPIRLTYDAPTVLLSLLVAMVASWFALFVASRRVLSLPSLIGGGLLMGLGIAAMHYIGMAALRMPAALGYDPLLFALSIVIAIGASAAALWLAFQLRSNRSAPRCWLALKAVSALVMGLAITGMHYTGMLAAHFTPEPGAAPAATTGIDALPIGAAIAIATLVVLGLAVISSLVDQRFSARSAELESLFRHNPDAVFAFDLAGSLLSANPAAERITGYSLGELRRVSVVSLVAEADREQAAARFQQASQGASQAYEIAITHPQGGSVALNITNVPIFVGATIVGVYLIARDITERRQADELLRASEERYRTMLAELSTPLIPITDQVVVMPLVGALDERRIAQMQTTLLHSLTNLRASWVIVDLTGVPVVDTQVAEALIRSAQAVRLLGAEVMLTGIRAPLAQTLVALGANLSNVATQSNLQAGIAYALVRVGQDAPTPRAI
jgi:PAS domain S-box-containing protein